MELSGSVAQNLRDAIKSARRLRGQRVYPDTVRYWQQLIEFARKKSLRSGSGDWMISELTEALESEMQKLICAAPRP